MVRKISFLIVLSWFLAACSVGVQYAEQSPTLPVVTQTSTSTPMSAGVTEIPIQTQPATPAPPAPAVDSAELPPSGATREFLTDFSKHTVSYDEILSGGPGKDGIPAIDAPTYVTIAAADEWLRPQEPVILVSVGTETRAYPIQILMWHEIVNDELGGVPLAVTFCPLCNTAIAFDRRLSNAVLDFGTTGRLRFSNLIMYDRQTESWWQQATGEALAGEYSGMQLSPIPAAIIAWQDFKAAFPDSDVLSKDTGYVRPYGENPYLGYDDVDNSPFLYRGPETPGVLLPMARVLTLELGGETVAYPYDILKKVQVIHDTVGGQAVVVIWQKGTDSPLDTQFVGIGREVGAALAYLTELDGQEIRLQLEGERIVDTETQSVWTLLGTAIAGPLTGAQLQPVVSINHFWFSWAAFRPETRVYSP